MEIELNFRLDGNGRTANPNAKDEDHTSERKTEMDYSCKATMTNLSLNKSEPHPQTLDDLLFDCEISDCGLMPRTFWMPAKGMEPRCTLEQLALDVFNRHVPDDLDYDVSMSGAEWWAQLRPSPEKTGRYAMHDGSTDDLTKSGISFHWDKDEDLRLLTGGTTYLHPHYSTVTYLTDFGSPTLVLNCRANNLTGEWIVPGDGVSEDSQGQGFISWPKTGKHIRFDGRYLHAAPPDLMEPGQFAKQIQFTPTEDQKQNKILKRRHRRVTFLVNVWINYKPFDVKPFPESMIDKLSGTASATRQRLTFQSGCTPVSVNLGSSTPTAKKQKDPASVTEGETESFTWPMGDCDSDENVTTQLPISSVRQVASEGGNVQIQWGDKMENGEPGMQLWREPKEGNAAGEEGGKKRPVPSAEDTQQAKRSQKVE